MQRLIAYFNMRGYLPPCSPKLDRLSTCARLPELFEYAMLRVIRSFVRRPVAFGLFLQIGAPLIAAHLGRAGRQRKQHRSRRSQKNGFRNCAHGERPPLVRFNYTDCSCTRFYSRLKYSFLEYTSKIIPGAAAARPCLDPRARVECRLGFNSISLTISPGEDISHRSTRMIPRAKGAQS